MQYTMHCVFREGLAKVVVGGQVEKECEAGALPGLPLWNSTTTYNAGELVVWNKVVWAALAGSTGVEPGTEPATWTPVETCAELSAKEGAKFEEEHLAKDPNEPGDPTSINVPKAPVITCFGGSSPKAKNGSSSGKPATLEFDQPATGALACEQITINGGEKKK